MVKTHKDVCYWRCMFIATYLKLRFSYYWKISIINSKLFNKLNLYTVYRAIACPNHGLVRLCIFKVTCSICNGERFNFCPFFWTININYWKNKNNNNPILLIFENNLANDYYRNLKSLGWTNVFNMNNNKIKCSKMPGPNSCIR